MTNLNISDVYQICRTCLLKGNDFVSIFCNNEDDNFPKYNEMIMSWTALKISDADGLPQMLCPQCVIQVCTTYKYLQQCQRSDSLLREHYENGSLDIKYHISNDTKTSMNEDEFKLEDDSETDNTDADEPEPTGQIDNEYKRKTRTSNRTNMVKQNIFPCKKCDKYFLSWNHLNEHNLEHPKTDKISCRFCEKEFIHIRHVFPHIMRQHAAAIGFNCGYCDTGFSNDVLLAKHLVTHEATANSSSVTEDRKETTVQMVENINISEVTMEVNQHDNEEYSADIELKCVECNILFASHDEWKTHQSDSHIENQFFCAACLLCFKSGELLNQHMSVHNKNGFNCHKKFYYEKNLNLHIETHDSVEDDVKVHKSVNGKHKCLECGELFKLRRSLRSHMKKSHSNLKQDEELINVEGNQLNNNSRKAQVCDICSKSFRTNGDLRRHILTHDPDKPFHCQVSRCKWSFASERDLAVHINVNHTDGSNECHFCQKVFKHPRNLRQHMITHKEDKRFTCKYCTKGFNHLHHLTNHERTHTGDTPYLCSECGKGFGTRDRLTFHMRLHTGVRPFECSYCGKTFTVGASLKNHLRTHTGERPFMCSHCGKTFTAKFNLNKHMRVLHGVVDDTVVDNELQTHVCSVCSNVFTDITSLSDHMKVHTYRYFCEICNRGFALTSALDSHLKTHAAGDRPYVCTICSNAFNRPEHLKAHIMRRHTGEKPYKCTECGRGFIQTGELNIHMRRHTGERPYVCQICHRGFIQSNALTSHMRTHTGERPYICAVCNKGHCTSGGLSQHMKTHSKVLSPADQVTSPANSLNV